MFDYAVTILGVNAAVYFRKMRVLQHIQEVFWLKTPCNIQIKEINLMLH
jgi:hypothetical protein